MKKTLALAGVVLAAGLLAIPTDEYPHGLPLAPNEDECHSAPCVWDAEHQGNGDGVSLLITQDGAQVIPHERAHALQTAWCARPDVTCVGYDD